MGPCVVLPSAFFCPRCSPFFRHLLPTTQGLGWDMPVYITIYLPSWACAFCLQEREVVSLCFFLHILLPPRLFMCAVLPVTVPPLPAMPAANSTLPCPAARSLCLPTTLPTYPSTYTTLPLYAFSYLCSHPVCAFCACPPSHILYLLLCGLMPCSSPACLSLPTMPMYHWVGGCHHYVCLWRRKSYLPTLCLSSETLPCGRNRTEHASQFSFCLATTYSLCACRNPMAFALPLPVCPAFTLLSGHSALYTSSFSFLPSDYLLSFCLYSLQPTYLLFTRIYLPSIVPM